MAGRATKHRVPLYACSMVYVGAWPAADAGHSRQRVVQRVRRRQHTLAHDAPRARCPASRRPFRAYLSTNPSSASVRP